MVSQWSEEDAPAYSAGPVGGHFVCSGHGKNQRVAGHVGTEKRKSNSSLLQVDLIPEGIAVSSTDHQKQMRDMQTSMLLKEGLVSTANGQGAALHDHSSHGHDDGAHLAEFGRVVTMIGVGLGFMALVVMEHFMISMGVGHSHGADDDFGHSHDHAHDHNNKEKGSGLSESFSLTAFAAIAVHSVVDGIVIGGSFRVSAEIGARVAVAIVLHKIPDGFVVASLLAATNRSRKPLWVALLSMATPLGAIVGYGLLTGIPPHVLGGVLGFAAGTFLFIAGTGIVPEILHEGGNSRAPIVALIAGWASILVVNFYIAPHSH